MRWGLLCVPLVLAGCAIERAKLAQDAREQMVGMTHEQVLACMGPPVNRAAVGQTEVWSYASGNGFEIANINNGPSSRRFCQINVAMVGGKVQSITYAGPTGGMLTAGEQCAFAVQSCVKAQ